MGSAVRRSLGLTLAVLLLSALAAPVFAQEEAATLLPENPFEWRAYMVVEGGWTNLTDLNDYLDEAGFDTFGGGYGGGGIGFMANIHRFVFAVEGGSWSHAGTVQDDADLWQAELSGTYGLGRFGFAVYETGGWQLYPLLGIGGGKANLRISNDVDRDFAEVLKDPKQVTDINSSFILTDLCFGFDYRFNMVRNRAADRSNGLMLGGRLGYRHAPFTAGWFAQANAAVENGPDIGLSGPYLQFVIGWGGGDIH
jgi:hypothetical protein